MRMASGYLERVTLALCALALLSTGCNRNFVYQRSVSELNNKATAMIAQGDIAGAIARLESARDLMPQEPSLLYNLALAYEANQQPDKAIALLGEFLEQHPGDPLAPAAMKSLGVLWESQGDALLGKAREAKVRQDAAGVARLSQESLAAYRQAETMFDRLAANTPAGETRQTLDRHLASLRKTIAQVTTGQLSPLSMAGEASESAP